MPKASTKHTPYPRLIAVVFGFAVLYLLLTRFAEAREITRTLARGKWQWVASAVLLQTIYYALSTALYQTAFRAVRVESRFRDLLPVWFASVSLATFTPLAGPLVFVGDAVRRGWPPARAAAGIILVRAADLLTFCCVLVVGLAYLFQRRALRVHEVAAALVFVCLTAGWVGALLLGLRRPALLRRILEGAANGGARVGGWLHRPAFFSPDWAERSAAEFAEGARLLAARPRGLLLPLGVALAAHGVDMASLYALFRAFHVAPDFGVLVAGFGVGILFWVVSITPEGVGMVEGMMALAFTSLGVPVASAAVVVFAFRGLTYYLPLLLGFFFVPGLSKTATAAPPKPRRVWGVRVAALLTAAMGMVNLLSATMPALADRMSLLREWMPIDLRHGSRLATALAGFALLLLALSLWRRKRVARLLTQTVLLASAAGHLAKGLDWEEATLALALAGFLWSQRRHFFARSDAPSIRHGVRVLVVASLFTLAYGTVGFWLLDRHFRVDFGFRAALVQTVEMFTAFTDPGLEPTTGYGRWFAQSLYLVGATTGTYALFALLRPVLHREPATSEERQHARTIVEAHGRSSVARFLLFDDKSYWFSQGGSVVAFALVGRICVALGDPVGPISDAAPAITGFRDFCAERDWQPTFYQTLPDLLPLYRTAGFDVLTVGEEAIVDVRGFTLGGNANKSLRGAMNRLQKAGCTTELCNAPHPDELMEELREVSDEWLRTQKGGEKNFSLGGFSEAYLQDGPLMIVRNSEGDVSAFANIIPEYQRPESTIDLMRRRTTVPNGTMDLLFVSLFDHARAQGFETFNLGLCPLSGVGETKDDPAVERALRFIYDHVDQFYNFKGLYEYKAKFHPLWSPRYLIHSGPATLLAVALAIIRADNGSPSLSSSLRELLTR